MHAVLGPPDDPQGMVSLQPSSFQKTEVSGPVEDDVVQQLDAHDFTRRFELGGDVDVALRRLHTAAGVIVGNDDRRSPVGQCIREDFARMHRTPRVILAKRTSPASNRVNPDVTSSKGC